MKVKNLFGMAAMAAVVMSSCSSDEVVNNYSQDNAIEFGTYVGRDAVSRVAVTDLNKVKNDGFGVFATYNQGGTTGTKPNFMNNQQVTWTNPSTETTTEGEGEGEAATEETGSWTYSPIKYWPNNASAQVSFWAYSPYNDDNDEASLTTPTFAVTDGTDFVVTEETVSGKLGYNEKVKLTFAHVMSRIGFKVETVINETDSHKSTDNGENDEKDDASKNDFEKKDGQALTTVVVTEVSLNYAFVDAGKMTWSAATEEQTKGEWNLTLTENSKLSSDKYHTLTVGETATDNKIFNDVTETEYEKAVGTEDTEDYQAAKKLVGQVADIISKKLNHDDAYFMVIPQKAKEMTITVKYSVITKDDKLATGYSKVDNEVTSEKFDFTFERNHAYNFVLHLGLNSVEFEAEVSKNWEESDVIVNVPLNEATTKTQPEA